MYPMPRRARKRNANRPFARREGGAERTDLDRSREQFVSDQTIRSRKREPVHRAARRQTITLGAMPSAVLHRTRGPNG
jgi:hypothetical protein